MNAKTLKTKRKLLDAFCMLSQVQKVSDITVSQLCREAGINRTTFYRYYNIPVDIIKEAVQDITQQIIYTESSPKASVYEYMLEVCSLCYANRAILSIYVSVDGNLMQMLYKTILQQAGGFRFLLSPVNNFIAGGVASTVMTWMLQGYLQSPEVIASNLTDYITRLQSEQ